MASAIHKAVLLWIALVVVAPSAWAAITPVKVVVEPAWQTYPFGNESYVLVTTNSKAAPNHDDAVAISRTTGARVARLNAAGTEGYTGGFDPGTDRAIYQQVKGDTSDVYVYDVTAKTRTKVPGVNTAAWEWAPRISSSFVLFFRNYRASGVWYAGIYLWNRDAQRGKRIASYRWTDDTYLFPGVVGERYAAWTWCSGACNAYLYDTQAAKVRKIPSVAGRSQSSPVLDEPNDLVFFVRAGLACGANTTFYSVPLSDLGGAPTKLATLPSGVQAWDGSLMPSADGTANDLLFTRVPCTGSADVYALPAVSATGT